MSLQYWRTLQRSILKVFECIYCIYLKNSKQIQPIPFGDHFLTMFGSFERRAISPKSNRAMYAISRIFDAPRCTAVRIMFLIFYLQFRMYLCMNVYVENLHRKQIKLNQVKLKHQQLTQLPQKCARHQRLAIFTEEMIFWLRTLWLYLIFSAHSWPHDIYVQKREVASLAYCGRFVCMLFACSSHTYLHHSHTRI